MKTWPLWVAGTLAGAAIIHILVVLLLPYAIAGTAISRMEEAGAAEGALHVPPPTAESRTVVRPSPDLAYSVCLYDLDEGPLLITARIPATYWSVSAYADNTDNFFSANDRDIDAESVSFIVRREDDEVQGYEGVPLIISPTDTGLILFRTLVKAPATFAGADQVRRSASCQTLGHEG